MYANEPHIGRLIKRLNDMLAREANKSMRSCGVSVSQMRVLSDLHRSSDGMLSLKELESRSGVAQSTMWGLVSRLESKGFVRTCAEEQGSRARIVSLTDAGRAVCDDALAHVGETEARLLADLSPDEVSQLRALLTRVCDTFG